MKATQTEQRYKMHTTVLRWSTQDVKNAWNKIQLGAKMEVLTEYSYPSAQHLNEQQYLFTFVVIIDIIYY